MCREAQKCYFLGYLMALRIFLSHKHEWTHNCDCVESEINYKALEIMWALSFFEEAAIMLVIILLDCNKGKFGWIYGVKSG